MKVSDRSKPVLPAVPILRFSLRYLGDESDAEEAAAETFVKVYRHHARFRPDRGKFSTWIFAIAANEARMLLRRRKSRPEGRIADGAQVGAVGEASSDGDSPDSQAHLGELRVALQKAITKLPHDLRTAFVLYEIEQRPYREIAQVLSCSQKAVERRLARAREKLQAELRGSWSLGAG